jgi:hypothetical protein
MNKKRLLIKKFIDDLESAISADIVPKVFIFFTNINLTLKEKENLIAKVKKKNLLLCEIMDREMLRIALDNSDSLSIRFQYLNIPLSEAEQASFFAKWGDDIQSVISTGFQKIEGTLKRVLFLQEANDPILSLTISFELNKIYNAEEISHFRVFCHLTLKEPKHNILSILFGSSDKSNRMRGDNETDFSKQKSGIKYGVGSGQWEQHINLEANQNDAEYSDEEDEKWTKVGSGSSYR